LITNGLAEIAFGTSLLTRMRSMFGWLFAFSIPLWWFFEQINKVVQNWHYILLHPISNLHYAVQASVSFSTVIPAVLSTCYLMYPYVARRLSTFETYNISIRTSYLIVAFCLGTFSFFLLYRFPHQTFPLVWIAPLLIFEPTAYKLGLPCLLRSFQKSGVTIPATSMVATLVTGFWWELWNFYSLPKWYYTIPYVGFWKLFEMPALGYLGYPFFGLFVVSYTAASVFVFTKINLFEYFSDEMRLLRNHPNNKK